MSLAEETRAAVRANPALLDALRAGVLNYAAAARWLNLDADPDAVATALRRYETNLSKPNLEQRDVRVRMNQIEEADDGAIEFGETSHSVADGSHTEVIAAGEVDSAALEHVLGVLRVNDVTPVAAGVMSDMLVVVVPRRAGADTVRLMERAFEAIPA